MAFPFLRSVLLRLDGGRLIGHFNLEVERTINGRRVVLPVMGNIGIRNLRTSEPWLDRVLVRLFAGRTGAFVDVGVNVGQTLLKVKTLAPAIPYVGFEPNPICFHYTQRLIERNRFENCALVPAGLSSRAALVPFFAASDEDISGSVIEGFRPATELPQRNYAAVLQGDAALETLRVAEVAVLKIDVEGGELEVLEGLAQTIRRARPYVICEILPLFSETHPKGVFRKPRQARLLAVMRDAGYRMYRLLDDDVREMHDIEVHGDMRLTNYLFAPIDEAPALADQLRVDLRQH